MELTNQQITLIAISLACLLLNWYSLNKTKNDKLPFADKLENLLPTVGGGAYALNFLFKLAN